MYSEQIVRLIYLLQEAAVPFRVREMHDGWLVEIPNYNMDAVCHKYSYGHEESLLEIIGGQTKEEKGVLGWLKAEEVARRFIWCYKHKTNVYRKERVSLRFSDYDSVYDLVSDIKFYQEKGYDVECEELTAALKHFD